MERKREGVIPLDTCGPVCVIEGSCACGRPCSMAGWSECVPSISMLVAISAFKTVLYRREVKVGEAEPKKEQLPSRTRESTRAVLSHEDVCGLRKCLSASVTLQGTCLPPENFAQMAARCANCGAKLVYLIRVHTGRLIPSFSISISSFTLPPPPQGQEMRCPRGSPYRTFCLSNHSRALFTRFSI